MNATMQNSNAKRFPRYTVIRRFGRDVTDCAFGMSIERATENFIGLCRDAGDVYLLDGEDVLMYAEN